MLSPTTCDVESSFQTCKPGGGSVTIEKGCTIIERGCTSIDSPFKWAVAGTAFLALSTKK